MTETSVETTETNPKTPEPPQAEAEENAENGHAEAETNGSAAAAGEPEVEAKEEVKEDPPKEMKSVVLMSFGGYKGVKIQKKPEPAAPQNGEVLIRVRSW